MEPPAKRTKVGRAPHDAPTVNKNNGDDDAHNNGKMSKGKKSSGKAKGAESDDDEIAMDPEDYAMKVDPEYRLDRNRAVADNKLKSAFELLFEKYSQDFGDTGDEINFYTDEIEVDNGHIASLPVERPSKAGDDQDSDEESEGDNDGPQKQLQSLSAAAKASSSRLVASLLPSRFGPGGTVIMSGNSSNSHQGLAPGEIDPTWAAPEIPDAAFGTPGGGMSYVPPPPPPRTVYAAPKQTVFTKALPTSFREDLTENGEDEGDDLMLDTPTSTENVKTRQNSSPKSITSKTAEEPPAKKRRKRTSSGPSAAVAKEPKQAAETAPPKRKRGRPSASSVAPVVAEVQAEPEQELERSFVADSEPSEPPLSGVQSSAPDVQPTIGDAADETSDASPPVQASLPTPLDEEDAGGDRRTANDAKAKSKSKEKYKRNRLDPDFVFSDDEDFGMKKRKEPQSKPATTATAASPAPAPAPAHEEEPVPVLEVEPPVAAPSAEKKEKKRSGRPRKSSGIKEAIVEATTEDVITEVMSLPEAKRREAESLSIIIMTSSRTSSAVPTPVPAEVTAEPVAEPEATATMEVEYDPEPEHELVDEPTVEAEAEAAPEPSVEDAAPVGPEPVPEPASEPEETAVEVEADTDEGTTVEDPSWEPSPPKETSDEQPQKRKRKRRRETDTDEASSPLPATQKTAKSKSSSKSLKSSQKSTSSTKSKTGRRRTREVPDSQSIGSSGIISLVSDGSADEAEVEKIAELSPRSFVPGSAGRQPVSALSANGSRRGPVQRTPSRSGQTTPSSRRRMTAAEALMATPSRHRSHRNPGQLTPTASRLLLLSPLARRQQSFSGTGSAASSPGGSPVQTPGGTMRRCGKDGFRCEREFCFRCT